MLFDESIRRILLRVCTLKNVRCLRLKDQATKQFFHFLFFYRHVRLFCLRSDAGYCRQCPGFRSC